MISPFYIRGAPGCGLGDEWLPFSPLAGSAALSYRSMGADQLNYVVRQGGAMPVPDPDQPVAFADSTGLAIFRGRVTKRKYRLAAAEFQVEISGPWQALAETPVLGDNGRPYLAYPMQPWGKSVADLLQRAAAAGIPIAPPTDFPPAWIMPKMAFRAATYAEALERFCALVPDISTRMDYSAPVPVLRFYCRATTPPTRIDLDVNGHGVADVDLDESIADRALGIAFAYCRRAGDSVVRYLIQRAGDDKAEARRKVSVFLSGPERTDMFVTEALTTAQSAVAKAQAAVSAVLGAMDTAAATAALPLDFTTIKARDSGLQAAYAAAPFSMWPGGPGFALYPGIAWGSGSGSQYQLQTHYTAPLQLFNDNGTLATGWWAVRADAFTAAQLQLAGATKETRTVKGQLVGVHGGEGSAGLHAIPSGPGHTKVSGYTLNYVSSQSQAAQFWREYHLYSVNVSVDVINMAPSEVAARVKAAAQAGDTSLVERAEFVEAPEGLAAFWFSRQDWPHFRGSLQIRPGGDPPMPGDFVCLSGAGTLPTWTAMAAPVTETRIDLGEGSASVELGGGAHFDPGVLDRLWVPAEDNYQAG